MKKLIFIYCSFLTVSLCLHAQTNTFPTSGNIGIGTTTPSSKLTIVAPSSTEFEGTDSSIGGGHHLELIGTSSDKALLKGPTITFRSPANTNGANSWATVRLMGAPGSTSTSNAVGAFHIQVRDQYNPGVGGTWNWRTGLSVINNGNVGIGTTTPDSKLSVKGNIHTKEVRVDLTGWSDFVFAKDYKLPTLQEVEQHIKEKGHLQDIPSAEEVEENGILLGDMNAKLLQKIEELTLYVIAQQKESQAKDSKIKGLEERLQKLEALFESKKSTNP